MGYPDGRPPQTQGGHDVTVYNRTAAKAAGAGSANTAARPRRTPRGGRATDAEFVFCCVGNDDDLRAVDARATTAPSPAWTRARSSSTTRPPRPTSRASCTPTASDKGVGFLDAPVSGGQAGAENGQLTVMVGGDEATFATRRAGDRRLRPRRARLMGPAGRRPAHQDGQPDLHRRPRAGARPRASHFAKKAGLDVEQVIDVDLQGRGAVLADGEPLARR